MTVATINLEAVSRWYGNVVAVNGISMTVGPGVTGLLGPNGAGKSTTLRMLYTLLEPDSGTARVDGFDIRESPVDVQSRIGVLSDAQGLYPRLTARENVRYFGRLHDLNGDKLEGQIEQLIALLDMKPIADRKTEGFSSGERLKVAIARALVHDPRNVLLDEPTNGLDVKSTRAMRQFIRRLRDAGKCILFTSHIMQEVAALCDQIIIISNGVVAAQGTPGELLQRTGKTNLEDAFIEAIGSEEGLQ